MLNYNYVNVQVCIQVQWQENHGCLLFVIVHILADEKIIA